MPNHILVSLAGKKNIFTKNGGVFVSNDCTVQGMMGK